MSNLAPNLIVMSCLSEPNVVFVAIEDFPDVLNSSDIAYVQHYFCKGTHAFRVLFSFFLLQPWGVPVGIRMESVTFIWSICLGKFVEHP